eukprot:gene4030-4377_t
MNGPRGLTCNMCGREFLGNSLSIHKPQCYKKQVAIWENGDPATRGPRPKDP